MLSLKSNPAVQFPGLELFDLICEISESLPSPLCLSLSDLLFYADFLLKDLLIHYETMWTVTLKQNTTIKLGLSQIMTE